MQSHKPQVVQNHGAEASEELPKLLFEIGAVVTNSTSIMDAFRLHVALRTNTFVVDTPAALDTADLSDA